MRLFSENLLGRTIKDAFVVVVTVAEGDLVLCDTLILVTDRGVLQLFADVHTGPRFETIRSVNDFTIEGDYDDRTKTVLRSVSDGAALQFPLFVGVVCEISRSTHADDPKELVGALLGDESNRIRMGIGAHLDDVEVGSGMKLWEHVLELMTTSVAVRVEKFSVID